MNKKFITLKHSTRYLDAVRAFLDYSISSAAVLDDNHHIMGVLSEKDLLRAMYPAYKDYYIQPHQFLLTRELNEAVQFAAMKTVGEVMNRRAVTTTPDSDVLKLGGLMVATGVHQVPVVENNTIVGMVSRRDVYRALLEEQFQLFNQRAKFTEYEIFSVTM